MNDAGTLAVAAAAGAALGAVFFGGLWWTVHRGVGARRPAAWFLGSLLLRTVVVLAGFWFVAGGRGDRLLAGLAGFVVARIVASRLARPPAELRETPPREAGHAA